MTVVMRWAFLLFIIQHSLCAERRIVVNEYTLMETCTSTCSDIGPFHQHPEMLKDPYRCQTVKDCKQSSEGHPYCMGSDSWATKWIYMTPWTAIPSAYSFCWNRCDMCECTCVDNNNDPPPKAVVYSSVNKWFDEEDLFLGCHFTCDNTPAGELVRTDFQGCQEVRNCRVAQERSAWSWKWQVWRCDQCQCDCINKKFAANYRLENVRYSMRDRNMRPGRPIAMTSTPVENTSPGELTITETLTFTKSESVSVETSVSIVAGLTLTIEAGVNWGVVSTLGVEASITSGFTTTSGTVKTEEFQHQIQGSITLQPGQRGLLEVVGHKKTVDIPYTATLVTTLDDGEESRESITGTIHGVETNQFRVIAKTVD